MLVEILLLREARIPEVSKLIHWLSWCRFTIAADMRLLVDAHISHDQKSKDTSDLMMSIPEG